MELSKNKLKKSLVSGLAGTSAIFIISMAGIILNNPILIAPFGASAVLLFGLRHSPLAKPKNLIGSHIISALTGLLMLYFFGNSYLVISIAVGITIFLMIFLDILHPPAGANPILIISTAASWKFLYINILLGLTILVAATFIYNKVLNPLQKVNAEN
ncbi:HPP-family protein [Clostridium pasteurianum DSM 525 = ATCC 6013]|uniref:HPP-family protein n=1 Tax=Clostridium pasteurianum DSM 525 = ATCC 6013 TaxID=1262449 RepID=A0A0H3J4V8_CLOPA|nr:HPP family protein [Clostridium pasteurianum]AJA46983.1 HPP-family protein [Clostridium pasteurianum DSM 525 = ATCC 6013]AJA50971.1 HPP-family protein [Clostridium pasteurianum DSM 525 = ATCC 6013]AOZ74361.1 HPP family protein [Clostridium pasteurianum DSM 525 = ATCC 6013]AOZ78159.1 HPP family protein [Clostridium pasteurianum]ELP58234.1 HPP-family protein [Clostridium pasteurianum DSM 525 = ATCC 6013]